MDCRHDITDLPERKRGQHLQREERGAIQALKRQGLSNRAIARELGCSPATIGNELRRGTPPRQSSKGRAPGYSASRACCMAVKSGLRRTILIHAGVQLALAICDSNKILQFFLNVSNKTLKKIFAFSTAFTCTGHIHNLLQCVCSVPHGILNHTVCDIFAMTCFFTAIQNFVPLKISDLIL